MIVLTGWKGDVTHLAIGPEGRHLAASGDGRGLELWDLPSGNKWGRYEHGIRFLDGPPAFHPTRPLCYACAYWGVAEIETDTKKARILRPPLQNLYGGLLWSLAPDGESFIGRPEAYGISRFRPKGDKLHIDWTVPAAQTPSRQLLVSHAVRSGPDGTWFVCVEAAGNRDGHWFPSRVSARATKDGGVLGTAPLPSATHPWPAVAPVGRRFVTVCVSRLFVWDAGDLAREPAEVKNDSRKHFTGIAFHPSGKYLAATSNDATVKLYDTTSWQVAKTYTWEIGRMRSVAFSPDGTLAAAGSDTGKVVVWDVDV